MNRTRKNSTFPWSFPPVLLLFLILSLLFSSCASPGVSNPSLSGEDSAETTGVPETDSKSETTSQDSAHLSQDAFELLALIEALESEIISLKQENFILANAKNSTSSEENAESPEDRFTYTVQNGLATVTQYTGKETSVTVPDTLGGSPVVAIGRSAFANTDITEVILPDSVTEIGWFAFADCYRLASLRASGVTAIGYGAFDNCPKTLTLVCPSDSYLAAYARSFGIAVKEAVDS